MNTTKTRSELVSELDALDQKLQAINEKIALSDLPITSHSFQVLVDEKKSLQRDIQDIEKQLTDLSLTAGI